jgi:outer membrane protein TolC
VKAVASSFLCLLAALAGCAVGPNYRVPKPDTPPEFAAATTLSSAPSASVPAPDLASWWRSLEDTELNSLVERAIKSNPDLEIALTRLQQARTYEAVVVGHAVPELDATAAPDAAPGRT